MAGRNFVFMTRYGGRFRYFGLSAMTPGNSRFRAAFCRGQVLG